MILNKEKIVQGLEILGDALLIGFCVFIEHAYPSVFEDQGQGGGSINQGGNIEDNIIPIT